MAYRDCCSSRTPIRRCGDPYMSTHEVKAYEPPRLIQIGTVYELTQGCDKSLGSSDGHTFMGSAIVCRS